MSTTSAISVAGNVPVTKKNQTFDTSTFIRLLTEELKNQNPTDPMKDTDFFSQIASLGQVDGLGKVNSSQQATEATALLGKTVTAIRPGTATGAADATVTGVVTSLSLANGAQKIGITEAGNSNPVLVDISSIQSVQPTQNGVAGSELTQAASLVGKNVTGTFYSSTTGAAMQISGPVKSVSLYKGVFYAAVHDTKQGDVAIPLTDITGVSS